MAVEIERMLRTSDGIEISAVHRPCDSADPRELALVVVHGFTNSWRTPKVRRVLERLARFGGVVALDMRGHGRSGGRSTVGHEEVLDVAAAIAWARELGYRRVATVGFSMGGSVVLREAALADKPVDAVVSVSAPAFWYYKGTRIMRVVHHLVENRAGRWVLRGRGVRVSHVGWPDPPPIEPVAAVAKLGGTPLLIVHGTVDHYFPLEHAHALHRSAVDAGNPQTELWVIDGFAHAESGIDDATLDAIGSWTRAHVGLPPLRPEEIGTPVGWGST